MSVYEYKWENDMGGTLSYRRYYYGKETGEDKYFQANNIEILARNYYEKKGQTPERIKILKQATAAVIKRQPLLMFEKGRLHSAVFAELKNNEHFVAHLVPGKRSHAKGPYIKNGIWNENEFFGKHTYLWTKNYINESAKKYRWWATGIVAFVVILLLRRKK
ncbi:hypothetical protein FACS1894153_0370 [Bacteroidia bacterium]|nr:hypothetical protein FACS1894153_0370 [Bacteroidia bacterium]